MEWLINEFRWMQWNWAGTLFFSILFLSITGLTVWDVFTLENRRKDFLPIATTRGDRFFIGIKAVFLVCFFSFPNDIDHVISDRIPCQYNFIRREETL